MHNTSVEITEFLSARSLTLLHYFDKNFVKTAILLKKLLNKRFDEKIFEDSASY